MTRIESEIAIAIQEAKDSGGSLPTEFIGMYESGDESLISQEVTGLLQQVHNRSNDHDRLNRIAATLDGLGQEPDVLIDKISPLSTAGELSELRQQLLAAKAAATTIWRAVEQFEQLNREAGLAVYYLLSGGRPGDIHHGEAPCKTTIILNSVSYFYAHGYIPLTGRIFRKDGSIGKSRETHYFYHPLLADFSRSTKAEEYAAFNTRMDRLNAERAAKPLPPGTGNDLSKMAKPLRINAAAYAARQLRELQPAIAAAVVVENSYRRQLRHAEECSAFARRHHQLKDALAVYEAIARLIKNSCHQVDEDRQRLTTAVANIAIGARPGKIVALPGSGARWLVGSCQIVDSSLQLRGWRILKSGLPGKRAETVAIGVSPDDQVLTAALGELAAAS